MGHRSSIINTRESRDETRREQKPTPTTTTCNIAAKTTRIHGLLGGSQGKNFFGVSIFWSKTLSEKPKGHAVVDLVAVDPPQGVTPIFGSNLTTQRVTTGESARQMMRVDQWAAGPHACSSGSSCFHHHGTSGQYNRSRSSSPCAIYTTQLPACRACAATAAARCCSAPRERAAGASNKNAGAPFVTNIHRHPRIWLSRWCAS